MLPLSCLAKFWLVLILTLGASVVPGSGRKMAVVIILINTYRGASATNYGCILKGQSGLYGMGGEYKNSKR